MRIICCLFIFLSVLTACRRSGSYSDTLLRAESLIPRHADSALMLLDSIPASEFRGRGDRALYDLLHAHALYKSYIDETNDSLVAGAADYFAGVGDTPREALALFLRGKININSGNLCAGLIYLLNAGEAAEAAGDYFLLGQIYRNLSVIYTKIYNGPQQIACSRKSVEAFRRYGDKAHVAYALVDLANSYNNNGEYDRCIQLVDSIVGFLDSIGNPPVLASAYINKATSLFATDRYHEAFISFKKAMETDSCEFDALARENMKIAYMKDPAGHCPEYDSLYSYHGSRLFDTEAVKGDYRSAYYKLLTEYNDMAGSLRQITQQSISLTADKYMKNRFLNAEKQRLEQRNRFIFSMVVLLLLAVIIWLVAAYRIRALRAKEAKTLLELKRSSEVLLNISEKFQDASGSIDELFIKRFSTIDRLLDEYYTCRDSSREQKHIYEKVKELFAGLGSDKQTFGELILYVNRYRNGLIDDLKAAFPQLKEAEVTLYVYYAIGLSSRSISILMSDSVENVYNRKSRLKKKLDDSTTRDGKKFSSFI